MPPRLISAFALSFALHGVLLFPGFLKRLTVAPPRPVLQASLRLPSKPEIVDAEPLLKDTLDPDASPQVAEPSPPQPKTVNQLVARREVQNAQRKLSQHLYYPAEAVEQGIEGEVRLIIRLSPDGSVDDVSVAASSGYSILDNAAIRAAYTMGKLSGSASRELILPVIFRLQ